MAGGAVRPSGKDMERDEHMSSEDAERRSGHPWLRRSAALLLASVLLAAGVLGGWWLAGQETTPERAAPPAAAAEEAVVWAVGDGPDGGADAKALGRMIAAQRPRPDRVLYLGDVYGSHEESETDLYREPDDEDSDEEDDGDSDDEDSEENGDGGDSGGGDGDDSDGGDEDDGDEDSGDGDDEDSEGEDEDEEENDYRRVFEPAYGGLAKIVAPTPGNHEWPEREDGYLPYWQQVTGREQPLYYSFQVGGWQVLSLNSEADHQQGSEQLRWLRSQLQTPDNCRIAFWHRPRYSAGPKNGDQPDVAPLWDALRGRASIVINGHEHNMQRLRPIDGITELISGAGGHELYELSEGDRRLAFGNASDYGALRLTLRPGSVRSEFVTLDGRTLDSTTLRCGKSEQPEPGEQPGPPQPPGAQ